MTSDAPKDYWRWSETHWVSEDTPSAPPEFVTVGIDVGSVSAQAVILLDGRLHAYANVRTGSNSPESAIRAFEIAATQAGILREDVNYCVGTGYGRIQVPLANRTLTEIACHARGANYIYGPQVRTVLDVGGQDVKVIRCDERGKVIDFLMNDKCAAGTGRGMEVIADLLSVPIEEVGERSFMISGEPPTVSNTCVVYAKSEAALLIRKGHSVNEALAAYCAAMADRIHTLLTRMGVEPALAVTGGIAKNTGVIRRLTKRLGIAPLEPQWDSQIAGALGAALFALDSCRKTRSPAAS